MAGPRPMKLVATGALWLALITTSACGGGDAPQAPPEESTSLQQGVIGRAPATSLGIPSVVTLTPTPGAATVAPTEPALMDQLGLAFTPTQLLVHTGQVIEFVNSESLAHNVHVTFIDGDSTVFLADMDPADRREVVLDREGGYDVTCDVHPGMRAFIFVTSAPYAALAEPDGSFQILDVPPGSYVAEVWSASPELRVSAPSRSPGRAPSSI